MDKKEAPLMKERPIYKEPKVTTYSEAEIMAELGAVNASELLNPLYFSVEL
jgi:hypothetical protein